MQLDLKFLDFVLETWVRSLRKERLVSYDHVQAFSISQPCASPSILHFPSCALGFSSLLKSSFLWYSNSYCIWTSEHYYQSLGRVHCLLDSSCNASGYVAPPLQRSYLIHMLLRFQYSSSRTRSNTAPWTYPRRVTTAIQKGVELRQTLLASYRTMDRFWEVAIIADTVVN